MNVANNIDLKQTSTKNGDNNTGQPTRKGQNTVIQPAIMEIRDMPGVCPSRLAPAAQRGGYILCSDHELTMAVSCNHCSANHVIRFKWLYMSIFASSQQGLILDGQLNPEAVLSSRVDSSNDFGSTSHWSLLPLYQLYSRYCLDFGRTIYL